MTKGLYGLLLCGMSLLVGCTSTPTTSVDPNDATAVLLDERRWREPDDLTQDYIKLASESLLPVQPAEVKVIGTSTENAVQSLATKIYLIENAKHTIDLTYYIFADDLAGNAILGALCGAVKRGVDVRMMVDSLGSYSLNKTNLKGLMQCESEAGYVIDEQGNQTAHRARVQAVVFNALTDSDSRVNNRSHDKLLIVDGAFADSAYVVTGGRNVSLSYYGLQEDGELDRSAFKDIEIVVKPLASATKETSPSQLSEYYFSVLFTKPGNKKLSTWFAYNRTENFIESQLEALKANPIFAQSYADMPTYLEQDFYLTDTKLAHELDNLNATDVVERYSSNKKQNANSISAILAKGAIVSEDLMVMKVVSPYLFLQSELLKDEGLIERDLNVAKAWLDKHPDRRIEVITNSVLTSDNFFTQAVIDMHTVPTMLMDKEMREVWLDSDLDLNENNPDFINSEAWQNLVDHPRVHFYQLGKVDSVLLGGNKHYGKLHAKFLIFDQSAFVGTTNLDFRSLLYNNEVGFFLKGEELVADLNEEFELLKSYSTRWGSEDWLRMRAELREVGGTKGTTTDNQRTIYSLLESTGLKYQF